MTVLQALLKHADRLVGRLIIQLLPPSSHRDVRLPPISVLFIRPGGIGDAVLLIPAVRALRRCFPGVSIDILAERRNAGVFVLCPGISSVRRYDVASEFRAALKSRYDLVIDTEQWHRLSAVAARLIRAGARIGFVTNERRRLFTQAIPYEQDDYEADSFMRLLAPLGCGGGRGEGQFLDVAERDAETAESLLASLKRRVFVTLFPGASIAERCWGGGKFAELATRLQRKEIAVVVVGSAVDSEDAETIERAGALNLAGKTSLAETAAVLARSSLLVSGDSGILHIAVGLGVPTVSLFGPGREKKWAPRGDSHIVINKDLPCSPCTTFGYTPKCPVNARCMADISVDEVESSVLALLATKKIQ
ncbi:glycosyltransferase family 9 protein [Geobacter benzoatilyticus]|uniref:Glycosyltransferase family 9 protein n=1 Tax=Geobacter benzoatilyticus TaxID=2815309 RepID=A0ABX7Q144_9BACT|nr:glycosyltransferase family 9 protein [Geobacter benzoatilyticus]QSV44942.1 glycosyltransferase family 9 protein [Geobacter benzoatilyticus]